MAAVSETIVREYFELHGFLVRQQRKYITQSRREDEDVDFFVLNPQPRDREVPLPFVLESDDLPGVARAVVVVKGWHTETFSLAVLANAPEIFRFVEPAAFKRAAESLGDDGSLTKILVVPALPQGEEAKRQSIELLRAKGIDCIIPFRTILRDLIAKTETNRNYQKSDLLQIIRVFKNYNFFKEPQLELFKDKRSRKKRPAKTDAAG
jgi:hypothetical protein